MRPICANPKAAVYVVLGGFFIASAAVADDQLLPHEWLDRMAGAVQSTNYEGTVVRLQGDELETLKVVHKVSDGVVREKVIVQDGDGVEFIRNGNEVHCILPDSKSVLVEEWNDSSTLFSTLPSSDVRFGSDYDVLIKQYDRVAGRQAVVLAIRPHDGYRYGYQLWLDVDTAFPLQTQLIGEDSQPLEQITFADIRIDTDILASALAPSYSTENWKWYSEPRREAAGESESDWVGDEVPPGFRVVSTKREILPGSDEPVTHMLYSDGVANVSVFIAAGAATDDTRQSSVGASNSYSIVTNGHRITVVGEVPPVTVEQIARSMRRSAVVPD